MTILCQIFLSKNVLGISISSTLNFMSFKSVLKISSYNFKTFHVNSKEFYYYYFYFLLSGYIHIPLIL